MADLRGGDFLGNDGVRGSIPCGGITQTVPTGTVTPRKRIDKALKDIARRFQVTLAMMESSSRCMRCCEARLEAYRLLNAAPYKWSLPRIGRRFNRDHTTVLSALQRGALGLRPWEGSRRD